MTGFGKKVGVLGTLALGCIVLMGADDDGCNGVPNTADSQMQQKQETMSENATQQVGLPGITNFTELRNLKRIYEERDKLKVTYTYTMDMQGGLHHVCDSLGYGFPYSTQFSNPEKVERVNVGSNWGTYTLPQSEPNGLFMPASADGTWVFCMDPDHKGETTPVYLEPRVIVSPFKMRSVGEYGLGS